MKSKEGETLLVVILVCLLLFQTSLVWVCSDVLAMMAGWALEALTPLVGVVRSATHITGSSSLYHFYLLI